MYKTSSKHVDSFVKTNGDPDIIQVLEFFENRDDAFEHEKLLLESNNIRNNDKFINRSIPGVCNGYAEGPRSKEHRRKISVALKGKKKAAWVIEKRKQTLKERYPDGLKRSDETKKKTSDSLKIHYEEPSSREAARQRNNDRLSDPEKLDSWLDKIHSEDSRNIRSEKRKELVKDPDFIAKLKEGINASFEGERGERRRRSLSSTANKTQSKKVRCACGYETNYMTMGRHAKICNQYSKETRTLI